MGHPTETNKASLTGAGACSGPTSDVQLAREDSIKSLLAAEYVFSLSYSASVLLDHVIREENAPARELELCCKSCKLRSAF